MMSTTNEYLHEMEKLGKYEKLGTVEELSTRVKEEDVLKFYYCESRDRYYVGKRLDTMYYAEVMVYPDGEVCLSYQMSRHLPWGKHVVDDTSAWKEHTYPSEPREINFSEWLNGFIKKECGGTPEECREAVEKQKSKKPDFEGDGYADGHLVYDTWICPCCGKHYEVDYDDYDFCPNCGQKLDWSDEE